MFLVFFISTGDAAESLPKASAERGFGWFVGSGERVFFSSALFSGGTAKTAARAASNCFASKVPEKGGARPVHSSLSLSLSLSPIFQTEKRAPKIKKRVGRTRRAESEKKINKIKKSRPDRNIEDKETANYRVGRPREPPEPTDKAGKINPKPESRWCVA